jgi:RNA polymerase sigma-70 factor (ECF subfamily)
MPATDEELIARAVRGDERAFTQLVRRYEQLVFGVAMKVCRDREKAEEAVQDTFINVFRKLKQFRGGSKFSTWLYTIVVNSCRMNFRKRKIDAEMVSLDEPPTTDDAEQRIVIPAWGETPESGALSRELRARLDAAIEQLPPDYRVVFVLRDLEELSAEETAKILKLSIPAVKSRLRRARVFLRDRLSGYLEAG